VMAFYAVAVINCVVSGLTFFQVLFAVYPFGIELSVVAAVSTFALHLGLFFLFSHFAAKYLQMIEHFYDTVAQGEVMLLFAQTTRCNEMTFYARVRGYNLMNELIITDTVVNEQSWKDGVFVVGEIYDFTNEPRD